MQRRRKSRNIRDITIDGLVYSSVVWIVLWLLMQCVKLVVTSSRSGWRRGRIRYFNMMVYGQFTIYRICNYSG